MLSNVATIPTKLEDPKNKSTIKYMRQAVKNCAYTIVNSNAVNGKSATTTVTYDMSPWKKLLFGLDGVLAAAVIVLIVIFIVKRKKAGKTTIEVKNAE